MATQLYVGNLSFKTSGDDLRTYFAQAGTVESASVIEDRETSFGCGSGNKRGIITRGSSGGLGKPCAEHEDTKRHHRAGSRDHSVSSHFYLGGLRKL